MKAYMIWQGGANYAVSGIEDTEAFDSIAAAVEAFTHRASGTDSYYPVVRGHGSEGHLFFSDPRDLTSGDVYPDRIISEGPRGGIRMEAV
jgi:hypothetical protein